MNANNDSSATPWYRQFWPWFLIALPATVVAASFYTLILANRHADDLVVDDYYKEGLAINRELRRQTAASDLGISANLSAAETTVTVHLTGSIAASQLRLRLSHPLEADRDHSVVVRRVADHAYQATLEAPLQGRWHWIVDTGEDSAWRLDGEQDF